MAKNVILWEKNQIKTIASKGKYDQIEWFSVEISQNTPWKQIVTKLHLNCMDNIQTYSKLFGPSPTVSLPRSACQDDSLGSIATVALQEFQAREKWCLWDPLAPHQVLYKINCLIFRSKQKSTKIHNPAATLLSTGLIFTSARRPALFEPWCLIWEAQSVVADMPCVVHEETDMQFGYAAEALETFPTRQC